MAAAGAIRIHRPRPVCRSCLQRLRGSFQWWRIEPSPGRALGRMAQPTPWTSSPVMELRLNTASRQPRHYRLGRAGCPARIPQWLQPPRPRDRLLPRGSYLPSGAWRVWRALPRDGIGWLRRNPGFDVVLSLPLEPGPRVTDAFLFDRQRASVATTPVPSPLMQAADVPSRVVVVMSVAAGWSPRRPRIWIYAERCPCLGRGLVERPVGSGLIPPDGCGRRTAVRASQWLHRCIGVRALVALVAMAVVVELAWSRWWFGFDRTSKQPGCRPFGERCAGWG